jgi:hypothetical protein
LTPKPDKDTTTTKIYRPISLMIINAKFLNKILINQIHQHICKPINVIHTNKIRDKKYVLISFDEEKAFDKI